MLSDRAPAVARPALRDARTWVVKVGSALVTGDEHGIDRAAIQRWCRQIAALHEAGRQVVLVSSGAIAEGGRRLGFPRRPDTVHELQAAAAAGQMGLIEAYEQAFRAHGLATALVLLTHEDLADRRAARCGPCSTLTSCR